MSKLLSTLIAIAFSAVSLNVFAAAHSGAAPAAKTEAVAPAADMQKDAAKPVKKAKAKAKKAKAKKADAVKSDKAATPATPATPAMPAAK